MHLIQFEIESTFKQVYLTLEIKQEGVKTIINQIDCTCHTIDDMGLECIHYKYGIISGTRSVV